MKLHGHKRQTLMNNSFIRLIIAIVKPLPKSSRDFFHCKPMILSREISFFFAILHTWLILAAMTEFELESISAGCERQDLVAQTDSQDWNFFLQNFFNIFY